MKQSYFCIVGNFSHWKQYYTAAAAAAADTAADTVATVADTAATVAAAAAAATADTVADTAVTAAAADNAINFAGQSLQSLSLSRSRPKIVATMLHFFANRQPAHEENFYHS